MDLDEPAPIAEGTALPKGCTITLNQEYYFVENNNDWGSNYTISGDVTINLNGKTFCRQTEDQHLNEVLFTISGEGNSLTIIDSSANEGNPIGSGVITSSSGLNAKMFDVTNGGKLTIEAGTFQGSNNGFVYIDDNPSSSVIIDNGQILGNPSEAPWANDADIYMNGGSLEINGGTLTAGSKQVINANGANFKITIKGGKLDGHGNSERVVNLIGDKCQFSMYGGTLGDSNGGGIYAKGESTINLYGGTIDGRIKPGTGNSGSSNIYLDGATLNMYAGTSGEDAGCTIEHSDAAGIEAYNGSMINMSGGTITNNNNSSSGDNSNDYGGGISLNGGTKGESGRGSSLIMKGGTISNNTANEAGGGVSVSGAGECTPPCSFTFENGTIENNSTNVDNDDGDHGGGIFVGHNGKFTMTGGTVSGNHARWGGGICIGSYTISGSGIDQSHKRGCTGDISITGGTIENNTATSESYTEWSGTGGGGINIGFSSPATGGSVIKIGGSDLKITNNTGQDYGGGIAIFESNVELTGGTISGNTTKLERVDTTEHPGVATHNGGGGLFVYVNNHGSTGDEFTMSGGTITGNTSKSGGGGIYVDGVEERTGDKKNEPNKAFENYGVFNMTGGTVSNNTAETAEGGGIRVRWAKAYIGPADESDPSAASTLAAESAQIQITGNETKTEGDWGGGGIFCEEGGYLFVKDALITKNSAKGFGGGVAACSTGDDDFTYQQAAAIFDNKAEGTAFAGEGSIKHKDQDLSDGGYITAGDGKDYFNSNLCDVAGIMLGGGDPQWSGTYGNPTGEVDEDGNPTSYTKETLTQLAYGSILEAKGYAALNSNPSEYDKLVAQENAKVIISENESSVHGGGILNNGTMFLGVANGNAFFAPEIQKTITGSGTAPEATFEFKIARGTYVDGKFTADTSDGAYTDTAEITVNADGTLPNNGVVRFKPDVYMYGAEAGKISTDTSVYYLITETAGSGSSYTYDTNQWLLTVKVTPVDNKSLEAIGSGSGGGTSNALKIESYSYQQLSSSGAEIGDPVTGVDALATFTNAIYTPPTPPSTPRTGSLTLHKVIVSGPAEAQSMAFTFHVTGPSGYSKDVTVIGNGTATLNGLKAGEYQVAEVGGAIDGYTLTATLTDDGAVTIKANATAEMTVTNTYEEGTEDGPVDPDEPSFPVEPGDPNNPNNPSNPANPGNPANPNDPTQAASGKRPTIMPASNPKMLPQTGDATPTGLIPVLAIAGIVTLAIGIRLLRRRKPLHLR